MSNLIVTTVMSLWQTGRKVKHTTGGWLSGNAVCCHHRGERRDTRGRGGIMLSHNNTGFSWHCFNCGFKAGWSPGHALSNNTRLLFKWLGLTDSELNKLILTTIREKDSGITAEHPELDFFIKEKKLPDSCLSIADWIKHGCEDPKLLSCIEYIYDRGFTVDDYNWHWSAEPGYADRVIIPFYHEGKIAGWTGRRVTDGKNRYLTSSQPGYVFNIDRQTYDRKYLIVVEGQFDAIAVDGVGILHNDPNAVQCARINALGKEVIVVPDRDSPGAVMIKAALANNWNVSLPPWGDDVKDVAEAMRRYGKLYVLAAILHYKESNKIKIELLKKKLENIDGRKKGS